jgi:hypothetical protein
MRRALFLLVIISTTLTACTAVKPWERGNLAKEEMGWSMDGNESRLNKHIYFAKEGSSGGGEAAGGGCGCN